MIGHIKRQELSQELKNEMDQKINKSQYENMPYKNGLQYRNVLSVYNLPKQNEFGIKIKTPIKKNTTRMVVLNIRGYAYGGGANSPLDIKIAFYVFNLTNPIIAQGYTSTANIQPEIKIGFEDDYAVVWINRKAQYDTFIVDAILSTIYPDYLEGWEIIGEQLSPSATDIVNVPYRG